MDSELIQIEMLNLRIPGVSREEAQGLGKEVMERVAKSLPAGGRRQKLGALELRVTVPVGTSRDQLAKIIALSILEKLA